MSIDLYVAASLLEEARGLPHGGDLDGVSAEEVAASCNGIGAAWMDMVRLCDGRTMTDLANAIFEWAVPASVRHDLFYGRGGTSSDRRLDDVYFYEDCVFLARALYRRERWWNPMRYARLALRLWQARKMYRLLRAFGWLAYRFRSAEDLESEQWIADERARVAGARLDAGNMEERQDD